MASTLPADAIPLSAGEARRVRKLMRAQHKLSNLHRQALFDKINMVPYVRSAKEFARLLRTEPKIELDRLERVVRYDRVRKRFAKLARKAVVSLHDVT